MISRLNIILISTLSVILFFSIVIYWRIHFTSTGEHFFSIFLWQLIVWCPWILYGYLNSVLDHKYPIVEGPVKYWILRHIFLCIIIISTHLAWFFYVSSQFSPFLGMENTRYGAFFFFFIMWAICDFLFYWALLGIYALRQLLSFAPTVNEFSEPRPDYVILKTTGRKSSVLIDNLLWIEAEDYCCRVHTKTDNYLVRQSLSSFEQMLPQKKFIRVHRSTIINLEFVELIEKDNNNRQFVRLKNGIERAISAPGYQKLQQFINS